MFAGTNNQGVFHSTDNGENWTAINNGLTSNQINSLIVIGSNIYAGTWGGGVFRSTDEGANWNAINNGLTANNIYGKYEYQRLPMGLCNSPDIFQERMYELFSDLENVRAYIDDLLVTSSSTFEDHLQKLEEVFSRLSDAGLKVNAKKSHFAVSEVEYLGYWITRNGIQPLPNKVQAIKNIAPPKTRKQLRSFIGMVNYYRDMWIHRSKFSRL